ncbi:MAG TPA: Rieske (2Fe-2S) protein [Acidimicrobiales bacterium]|nr:Rieske (2Fe-2S) protein [Acidimicrobiales bacterium]
MSTDKHDPDKHEIGKRDTEAKHEARAAFGFFVTFVAAIALAAVYWRGGNPQLEGVLLATALAGLAYGFVVWGHRLLPQGPVEQARHELESSPAERRHVQHDLERAGIGRRKLLTRMLGLAAAALGAAAVFPIRSLGPSPGRSLQRTPWRPGSRLVDEEGHPLKAEDIPLGGFFTVFPEGHVDSADGQTVLVRVEPDANRPRPGREDWAPLGYLAYNKVCTHAGCPVGLYQADTHKLFCPCHQSAFAVLDGARPVFGPATRSLPQLPLMIDADGFLRARSDYTEPIGPAYWNRA